MSERQSKKRRQNAPTAGKAAAKKSPAEIWTNVGIGVIVAGFLVLAGFAMKPAVEVMIQNYQAAQPQDLETVEEYAKTLDQSAEDFMNEYGLTGVEEITKDTPISQAKFYMSLENFAKFTGVTIEEFRTSHGLDDEEAVAAVTNETTYLNAQQYMKAGAVAQDMGVDFATIAQDLALPEGVMTEESKWGDVLNLAQMMQQVTTEEVVSSTEVEIPEDGGAPVASETTPEAQAPATDAATEETPAGEGE